MSSWSALSGDSRFTMYSLIELPAMQEYYYLAAWLAFGAVVLYILTVPGRRGRHLPPGRLGRVILLKQRVTVK
jgi:hypothetical protein